MLNFVNVRRWKDSFQKYQPSFINTLKAIALAILSKM